MRQHTSRSPAAMLALVLALAMVALPAAAQRTLSFAPYVVPDAGSIAIPVRALTALEAGLQALADNSGMHGRQAA